MWYNAEMNSFVLPNREIILPEKKIILPQNEIILPESAKKKRFDDSWKGVIAARSGSGKTTLARYLGEKYGCLVLEGDQLRFLALKEFPRVAMAVFGAVPHENETGEQFAYRMYKEKTMQGVAALAEADFNLFDKTNNAIDQYISEIGNALAAGQALAAKYRGAALHNPEKPTGGLIVEGIFTDGSSYLNRDTDVVMYLRTDDKLREEKLAARLMEEGFPPEVIAIILEARDISYARLAENTRTPGLRFFNGYDNPSLQDNAASVDFVTKKLSLLQKEKRKNEEYIRQQR